MTTDKITKSLDIAIIGTGAIGGYYGSRLHHAGHSVHFLVHSEKEYEHIEKNGLKVDSFLGDFSVEHPLIYKNVTEMPKADLIIIAVKATANDTIFPMIAPLVKDDADTTDSEKTDIILMQNGFGFEKRLALLYPNSRIFGGLCFICSFKDSLGHIRHTDYGAITLAQYLVGQDVPHDDLIVVDRSSKDDLDDALDGLHDFKDDEALEALADILRGADIEVSVNHNLVEARIKKLIWNIPYNGLSVICDCNTDVMTQDPSLRLLVRATMEEIREAAYASGIVISEEFLDEMVQLTVDMEPYSPSMRLDYLAGRMMEIEALYTGIIHYASNYGYNMKIVKTLRCQLQYLERARLATR
ncbi:MAG: 2-dehydropantoate 2-reductase [Clostridiales Family XIII bacterium]|jgi:2-dehydropantoate 2-reductase|nr:2-dehydropantoate 2-reductase [Clostridiales Family XIII bacterium]